MFQNSSRTDLFYFSDVFFIFFSYSFPSPPPTETVIDSQINIWSAAGFYNTLIWFLAFLSFEISKCQSGREKPSCKRALATLRPKNVKFLGASGIFHTIPKQNFLNAYYVYSEYVILLFHSGFDTNRKQETKKYVHLIFNLFFFSFILNKNKRNNNCWFFAKNQISVEEPVRRWDGSSFSHNYLRTV